MAEDQVPELIHSFLCEVFGLLVRGTLHLQALKHIPKLKMKLNDILI